MSGPGIERRRVAPLLEQQDLLEWPVRVAGQLQVEEALVLAHLGQLLTQEVLEPACVVLSDARRENPDDHDVKYTDTATPVALSDRRQRRSARRRQNGPPSGGSRRGGQPPSPWPCVLPWGAMTPPTRPSMMLFAPTGWPVPPRSRGSVMPGVSSRSGAGSGSAGVGVVPGSGGSASGGRSMPRVQPDAPDARAHRNDAAVARTLRRGRR